MVNMSKGIGEFVGAGVALGIGLAILGGVAENLTGNAQVGVEAVISAITGNLGLLGVAFLVLIAAVAWHYYKSAGIGGK